ncbi:esterase/lipase family protein [Leptolyngbya iicbica]|uniref:Triacylglycerol lipase n=2 Tax=Cyanophyceae TaxID=3028117 RepID=A0A4Q7E9B0_9CYAN|nr:triacylglycerol lipase [Leptolyngbya sp. LK]RZM79158.1 triacylglycerol lipase [Leptolyngbya sp. LK]
MSAPRLPVLLIHGIDDTAKIFQTLVNSLSDRGWPEVHAIDLVPSNGDIGLDELAAQIQAYVEANLPAPQQFDLVGFSMGGIVSRYYLQRLGGLERVRHFVTLSSPHNGTWTGYLRSNPGARQMRPKSEFLQDLNSTVDDLTQVEFTSVWTPFDLMIVPANSSELPVGTMMQLPVLAHPWMVSDPRAIATLADLLGHELDESTKQVTPNAELSA